MNKLSLSVSILTAVLIQPSTVKANDFSDVSITSEQVSKNVYILYGAGGNIAAQVGKDGTLIVDDQFEPLAPKIEKALTGLSDNTKVSYVVNTHFHADHTSSNVYFSKSASILAHENVRKRLSVKSKEGLPVITYQTGVKLHLNDDTIDVQHLGRGHTDGDSVIYFKKANVWHLGDLFFADRFPYVDLQSGGQVSELVTRISTLLERIDDSAKVIPGHGTLTDKKGLQIYLDMIKETKSYVDDLKAQGLTEEQVIEKGLDKKWQDWSWAFINEPKWISTLYKSK